MEDDNMGDDNMGEDKMKDDKMELSALKYAYDRLSQMIWIYNKDKGLIYLNSHWFSVMGHSSTNWLDFVHPDDREKNEDHWQKCEEDHVDFESRYRFKVLTGEYRWYLVKATYQKDMTGYWIGTCIDISASVDETTRYKNLSDDLSARRELIVAVLDNLPVAVIVAEAPSGKIMFANNKMWEIWRFSLKYSQSVEEYGDWIGFHSDGSLYKGEEWPLARSLVNGEIVVEEIAEILRGDGTRSMISLSSSPIVSENGKRIGAVVICQDINEKIRLQQERVEAISEAKNALEASRFKSNFIANMSHDLRTPINGMIGMTNLLFLTNLTAEQKEYVNTINDCGKTLINLINDILDLSKMEAGRMKLENIKFSLREVVNNVIKIGKAALVAMDKVLTISLKSEGGLPSVMGDSKRLEQILTNLVSNSLKFTPTNGHIEIKTFVKYVSKDEITFKCQVVDNGIGIDKKVQDKLFSPFIQGDSSTTRQYGGSGLGLSICRDLVHLMKGEIFVESKLGNGSTFTIRLPLQIAEENRAESDDDGIEETIKTPADRESVHILLAEDNRLSAIVAQRLLKSEGYRQVEWVKDGQEAYMAIRNDMNNYDIILMDCQMPIMDGFEATRKIRQLGARLPIIALTASATQDDKNACLECGMDAVIFKPFDPKDIARQIDYHAFWK